MSKESRAGKFAPMLAVGAEPEQFKFPLYASLKLDGIRCLIRDGQAFSRKLKPIENAFVQSILGGGQYEGMDGELIVGDPTAKNCFQVTGSGVMKKDGTPDFTFFVFERHDAEYPDFASRFLSLQDWPHAHPRVQILEQRFCSTLTELLDFESESLEAGHEGLITRSPDSPYKMGRSTVNEQSMLKLKRFFDSEAKVLGLIEGLSNQNVATVDALGHTKRSTHLENQVTTGTMGSMILQDLATKVIFTCPGTTTAMCKEWWSKRNVDKKHVLAEVGLLPSGMTFYEIDEDLIVKYKYFPIGVKDKPRFPGFLGVRHAGDMS